MKRRKSGVGGGRSMRLAPNSWRRSRASLRDRPAGELRSVANTSSSESWWINMAQSKAFGRGPVCERHRTVDISMPAQLRVERAMWRRSAHRARSLGQRERRRDVDWHPDPSRDSITDGSNRRAGVATSRRDPPARSSPVRRRSVDGGPRQRETPANPAPQNNSVISPGAEGCRA